MAVVGEDARQGLAKVVASINLLSRIGATDSTISGNSTITALCTALQQLPALGGHSPETITQICAGLRLGVQTGAIPETHGVSTIAGLRALVSPAQTLYDVSANDHPLYA